MPPSHLRRFKSRLSTVHRGTAFEERSRRLLEETMSMTLTRVGGRADGGIDLQGWWWLPLKSKEHRDRLRVIGQCKAVTKKISPNFVREMEGVLARFLRVPMTEEQAVAMLVSEAPFSQNSIVRTMESHVPFLLLHLPPLPEEHTLAPETGATSNTVSSYGTIGQAIWNPALGSRSGLLGGRAEIRWVRSEINDEPARPGLWWEGSRLANWVPGGDDHGVDSS